jgi:hypothetical protein
VLVVAIISLVNRKNSAAKLFATGVSYLKVLRMLLMHIQQHRGMTNAYLNGNASTEAEIIRIEAQVKADIETLEAIHSWLPQNSKWESLVDHWLRINSNFKGQNAEVNLKQHNTLIANLLYLIDDVAYAHQLGKLGLLDVTDTDWRKLLFVAEYVGQARALGMGAVSKGHCSSVLRIQLNHLYVKIEASINQRWSDLAKQDFIHLLSVLQRQVIIDQPTISPTEYFSLATSCIEHVLREFDRQVELIQQA